MEQTEVAIIGAGVIGLAVAAEISRRKRDVVVLEQHSSFGQETSSRSSEVIHAGIYYARDSLKARLCVEGNRLLYRLCETVSIPHKRIGKLIVAKNAAELDDLERLSRRARDNGVEDIRYLSRAELDALGPKLTAAGALHSPSTGIVDSHSLMKRLEYEANRQGALFSYDTKVLGIERQAGGYVLDIADANGEATRLRAEIVVNCAGLSAEDVAAMVGLDTARLGCAVQYWKGEFCKVRNRRALPADVLVYPVQGFSVGIHTVVDLQGEVKLGPKNYPIEKKIDYAIDARHKQDFYETCKPFFPLLELDDLTPDMAGISPALEAPREDWLIAHEEGNGLPGFVNLIGLKSPALTACLAIARHVGDCIA